MPSEPQLRKIANTGAEEKPIKVLCYYNNKQMEWFVIYNKQTNKQTDRMCQVYLQERENDKYILAKHVKKKRSDLLQFLTIYCRLITWTSPDC